MSSDGALAGRWHCPVDGGRLDADGPLLRCAACGGGSEVVEGIAVLARGVARDRVARPLALLDELWSRVGATTVEAVAAALCRERDLYRSPNGAAWKLLIPVPAGGAVLHIGPGLGDNAADFASRAASVAVLAAHLTAARIVRRHLTERGAGGVDIAVMPGLERLPVDDASFDAVIIDEVGARGFGVGRAALRGLAAELKRVTAPGGAVLVGVPNPLHRLPGASAVLERVAGGQLSLGGALREAQADPGVAWGRTRVERAMRRAGFPAPEAFAPIPGDDRPRAILPEGDPAVVRYFLSHQVRRNTPAARVAVAVAGTLLRLGLFHRVVPHHYLLFRMERGSA